jgi:flagellar basal-body rod protein FlgC
MDYLQAFAISAAGMSVERTRVDVAALNLANANTVQTADGVSYQPSRVVARAAGVSVAGQPASFAEQLERGLGGFTLPEASIEPSTAPPRMVYEPGHPFANERGFVAYPGVDSATEMVGLMTALRAYEANVAALNAARTLAQRALEIGGGT